MQKHLMSLMAVVLCAMVLLSGAAAESTGDAGVAWTFPVALADLTDRFLVLASAEQPLEADYIPAKLETLTSRRNAQDGSNINGGVYMASSQDVQLASAAANALIKMMSDAEVQGVVLYARQGYRSYADQQKRYDQAQSKGDTSSVQKPGQCDYQTGLAVTVVGKAWRTKALTTEFASSAEGQWLLSNCGRYGFILRYPEGKEDVTGYAYEPWHLRFVGSGVSSYIVKEGLTLEEFHAAVEQAYADFAAAGGDVETAIAATQLPEGAAVLESCGPDGDHEIVLFHD